MGGVIDQIANIAVPIALTAVGQPELAAAYVGIRSGMKSGSPLGGLAAAGGSYFGGQLGSSLGSSLGSEGGSLFSKTASNALGDVFGGDTVGSLAPFGSFAGNALGSSTIGSSLGAAAGSSFGEDLGSKLGTSIMPGDLTGGTPGPQGFSPSRSPQMGLPQSLSQFGSGMDPFQQATNIATKGVYGGGQGKDENSYFLNLINRQLVDDGGNAKGLDSINPVESSYLSQLGLGGYNNSNDLLKGISQYAG